LISHSFSTQVVSECSSKVGDVRREEGREREREREREPCACFPQSININLEHLVAVVLSFLHAPFPLLAELRDGRVRELLPPYHIGGFNQGKRDSGG